MQKRTLFAAVAVAATTAFVVPNVARAQDPKPTPQPPTTTVPQTSKGEVAMQPTYSSLVLALDSLSARVEQLKALTALNAENVQLVNVEQLLQGDNADSLTAAIQRGDTAAVSALRATLGANPTITTALSGNAPALTPADVIATDVAPDGKVTIYYWKKQ